MNVAIVVRYAPCSLSDEKSRFFGQGYIGFELKAVRTQESESKKDDNECRS